MRLWTRLTSFTRTVDEQYPPIGRRVQLPHGGVHCLADGPKGAAPIVLLHGASGNLRDFTLSLLPRIARSRRVIALDRPGFGHSDLIADGWRLRTQIGVLRSVLTRFGHERYVLVGHSYSGALALAWALTHPREVAGVGIVAGAAMDWGGELEAIYRIGGAPLIGPLVSQAVPLIVSERWISGTLRTIFSPLPVPERYRRDAGIELALRPHTFQVNFRAMNRLYEQIRDAQPQYPRIKCPVAIIHGLADRVVPAEIHAKPLAGVLPSATLTLLGQAGHMPHHSDTEAVAAALLALPEM